MNKIMSFLLAAFAIGFGIVAQGATVTVSTRGFYADGSSVDGAMRLGYAPTEKQNAVVKIGDEVLLNAGEAGSFAWYAPTAGTCKVSHTVGDDVLSATYVVTNGYAKIEDEANPPMDLVEGITISPMEISAAAKGGRSLITISGNGEAWTGATSADWLTLNSTEGTAEGKKVICTVGENGAAESRVGYVYIAGQEVTVTQAGRGATVDTQVVADTAGGEVSVAVSVTDETTTWGAWSDCSWISVLSRSGTGSGEVKLQVASWNKFGSRTGTVTVAGQIVTVTQEAAKIDYPMATEVMVGAEGDSSSFEIAAADGVTWMATSDASWLVVEDDSQSTRGNGTVSWTVRSQTTTLPRTATIIVTPAEVSGFEPWVFTVIQEAAAVELSEMNAQVSANAETVSVDVAVADNVVWKVENLPSWIMLNGVNNHNGADAIQIIVVANPTGRERSATIRIANKGFVVTQAAAQFACPTTTEKTVGADKKTGEISISATDGVSWSATSDADWLVVDNAGVSRLGNGTISWTAHSQTTIGDARTATITVTPAAESGFKPWAYTITQASATWTCPTETETTILADSSSGELEVVTVSGISWLATSDADWLVVDDAGFLRAGNGTITWTAQSQTTVGETRTATITVKLDEACGDATWTYTVRQEGSVVELSKVSAAVCAQGEDVLIDVSVASGVDWSIENVPEWMTLEGEVQRKCADTVKLTVTPNTTYEERSAVMTIAGKEFIVTQAAAKIEFEGSLIRYLSADGGDLEITVRVDVATAPWSIDISEDAKDDWVFLLEGDEARVGSDIFTLSVWESSDEGELPREATVTLGTQVLTIRQVSEIPDPVPTVAADAEEEQLVLALEGSADKRLAENIKDTTKYAKYHAWVDKIAGTGVDHYTARQNVKDSELTWFAYALDLSALPEKAPESLTIDTILSAAKGGWDLEVKVGDLKVGSDASAADFGTVFTVEGAADLKEESFSAENVTTTFGAAENGKVKVEVEPKEAKGQFFIRVKMTP